MKLLGALAAMPDRIIEFCPQKELKGAEVEPEHDDHDAGQTAVHVGKAVRVAEEKCEQVGCDDPSDRYAYCTGKNLEDLCLGIGKDPVYKDQAYREQDKYDQQADRQNEKEKAVDETTAFRDEISLIQEDLFLLPGDLHILL